ncbi:AAA family ATPase [Roseivirga sp. BDSF3-8]|uniref:AAA family ATPase n=1 Tax=Roseivirga sp. BDSF3-8 TaxID=3241598 RepID=UPI0035319D1D
MKELGNQGFKLLAIQPRKGCHPDFRKVLKEGEIYSFYPAYKFERNKAGEVTEIIAPKQEPRLYDIGDISVNISAVVGKNGSGKSTLIELLYYTVYFLSTSLPSLEKNNDNPVLLPTASQLDDELKGLEEEKNRLRNELREEREAQKGLYNEDNTYINRKAYITNTQSIRGIGEELEKLNDRIRDLNKEIALEENAHQLIVDHLKLSVYYLFNGCFYELQIDRSGDLSVHESNQTINESAIEKNRSLNFTKILSKGRKPISYEHSKEVLDNFFYTVAINYSHYALNSNSIGKWIERLFHKNDAYTAPVVINPMRNEGGFDINEENSFAKYRLLYNLLIEKNYDKDKRVKITDNQYVDKVRFTLDSAKIDSAASNSIRNKIEREQFFPLLNRHFPDNNYPSISINKLINGLYSKEIYEYIRNKLRKISRTYPMYNDLALKGGLEYQSSVTEFLKRLKEDNSHITFKLKQAINFLRANSPDKPNPWSEPTGFSQGQPYFEFTLDELLDWMPYQKDKPEDIINYLPPPIFTIDFLFTTNPESSNVKPEVSQFSALSSGEQQLIHSIQSVLYHLNNLRSAHHGQDERQKYKAVNIVYDEIELYFHPEYQRKFICRFLKSIKRLNLVPEKEGIKYINILFSTHSPFVLSDIPSTNILRLKEGRSESETDKSKTFGANIYSLLKDSFFLDAYIGKHARLEIQKLINTLRDKPPKDNSDLKIDEKLDESSELLKERIEMIGEPFLREKLSEMYYKKFAREKRISDLENEIKRLKEGGEL